MTKHILVFRTQDVQGPSTGTGLSLVSLCEPLLTWIHRGWELACGYPKAAARALTECVCRCMCRAKKVQNRAVINTCPLARASRAENRFLLGFGVSGTAGKSSQEAMLSHAWSWMTPGG